MTWTDFDPTLFETGDQWTESNILTYLGNNLLALAHPLEAPTTADLDVVSSASETTLYSVTVLANKLGTNGSVIQEQLGDYLFNRNVNDTMRIKVKFGGSTLIDTGAIAGIVAISASRHPWQLVVKLQNRGATDAQLLTAFMLFSRIANATTGTGQLIDPGGVSIPVGMAQNTSAIDTTVDQTFAVSVQWGVGDINNSWRRRWARTLLARN
jgi:hypothetical protein